MVIFRHKIFLSRTADQYNQETLVFLVGWQARFTHISLLILLLLVCFFSLYLLVRVSDYL
jgi:hypothetical protein